MSKPSLRLLAAVLAAFVAGAASSPTLTFKFKTIKIPGAFYTEVDGVNNLGVMVGVYADNNTSTHGFMLSGQKVTTIDDPKAAENTGCRGINNGGAIVGTYLDSGGNWRGFLYKDHHFSDIGPPWSLSASANAINDKGKIVGRYTDSGGAVHGFLWNGESYKTIDAPGATFSDAVGINNGGTIVVNWVRTSQRFGCMLRYFCRGSAFDKPTLRLITFDQFSARAVSYRVCQPALEEVMENFGELMQRLLELQSGGRQRSPKLIAEDRKLMNDLQKRSLAGNSTQTARLSPDGRVGEQFKA